MKLRTRLFHCFFFLLVCICNQSAQAGSFNVLPVRIFMDYQNAATSITVKNSDKEPILIQTDVHQWRQPQGTQELLPTTEILVSPPIFELAAGEQQIVRIAYLGDEATAIEQTFRLFLTEVPIKSTKEEPSTSAVNMALRLSLPIFISSEQQSSHLNASIEKKCDGDQAYLLKIKNDGTKHVMILKTDIKETGSEAVVEEIQHPAYLLSDAINRWPLTTKDFAKYTQAGKLQLYYETVKHDKAEIPLTISDSCFS